MQSETEKHIEKFKNDWTNLVKYGNKIERGNKHCNEEMKATDGKDECVRVEYGYLERSKSLMMPCHLSKFVHTIKLIGTIYHPTQFHTEKRKINFVHVTRATMATTTTTATEKKRRRNLFGEKKQKPQEPTILENRIFLLGSYYKEVVKNKLGEKSRCNPFFEDFSHWLYCLEYMDFLKIIKEKEVPTSGSGDSEDPTDSGSPKDSEDP